MKQTVKLKLSFEIPNKDKIKLAGRVYGHSKFEDGMDIITTSGTFTSPNVFESKNTIYIIEAEEK